MAAKCSATLGPDSNIALLPISGFSAKLVMTSRICQTTTLYRLILASDSPSKIATLVRCTLETGRTHQIRVHLAAADHPLVGDPAYGRGGAPGLPRLSRQALHATRLGLIHPQSGASMQWTSAPPEDFQRALDALRKSAPR